MITADVASAEATAAAAMGGTGDDDDGEVIANQGTNQSVVIDAFLRISSDSCWRERSPVETLDLITCS
jgi:hypothetical protein